MKGLLIILFGQFLVGVGLGQNLIPNPGFEEFYRCPNSLNLDKSKVNIAPHWASASMGTPDVFNRCNDLKFGIQNSCGFTSLVYGQGFAGIIVWEKTGFREYLQVQLKQGLDQGAEYRVSFKFQLSSYSMYACDRIGVAFGFGDAYKGTDKVLTMDALAQVKEEALDLETGTWESYDQVFVAKGGEDHLVVGNFALNSVCQASYLKFRKEVEPQLAQAAYYYLDEFKLELVHPTQQEFDLDQAFQVEGLNFENASSVLREQENETLDKLAEFLKENESIEVLVNGYTDTVGTVNDNLMLSEARASAVKNYLVDHGVRKTKIKVKGYGESTIMGTEGHANYNAENRRVEIMLIKPEE